MDDHLPSGSPLQQHLSIGLGTEPFTGPSGWLLGWLAGWLPTQEIYVMIAILGKHGLNISNQYSGGGGGGGMIQMFGVNSVLCCTKWKKLFLF